MRKFESSSQQFFTMATVKNFSVVLFTKDNTYAVVPSTWLKEGNKCYWPGRKTKNPTKLGEDYQSVPDKTFKLYEIEFIKSYGN